MGKDTIKVLSEREQARQKVAIWFGSRDNFIHPFREALANAIDEIKNNFEFGEITVRLESDGRITVTDTGRGIPLTGSTDGIPNYHLLLLKLFAGTNYDNGENGKIATGTNGVGLTVTNYCSSNFHIKSYKRDSMSSMTFENGGDIAMPLKTLPNDLDILDGYTGTTVSFILDKEVFGNYKYNRDEVESIVRNCAGVNKKINFIFQYECEDANEYKYESLEEFFNEDNTSNTCKNIIGTANEVESEVSILLDDRSRTTKTIIEKDIIEFILTTSAEPVQKSFLNATHLSEGGTVDAGVILGVRNFVNKYIKESKLMDKKLGVISKEDVELSISYTISVLSTLVEFANQTKLATNKTLYRTIVAKYVEEVMELEKIQNFKNIDKLVKHILEIQKFNSKAQANKNKLKKELGKKVDNISNRIEGLVDCKLHGEDSEIFITEGKSALGSVVLARDAKFQAGFPIRGKITNVLKKSMSEILESQTVMEIIKILGCGIDTDRKHKDLGEFCEEALRYGKIMIATDMDADGYQIQCLLLTLFYKLTPTLIKNGRVYIVNTPLYEVRLNDDTTIYWYSETEKQNYIKCNGESEIKHMARCKGLGELDAEVMAETGVNPDTRNITQVTVDNFEEMIKTFEIWMGESVEGRKKLITENLNKIEVE